jgi:serine protease Do
MAALQMDDDLDTMFRPFPHRPDWNPSATRLAGGVALVLAGGAVAAGLLWPRMVPSGRGSAGPRSTPAGVAVTEADPGTDPGSERLSSAKDPARSRSARDAAGREEFEGRAADRDGDGHPGTSGEATGDELSAAWDRLERRVAAAMARARESVVALEYTAADAPAGTRRVATGVVINNGGEILSVRIDPPPTRPAPGTGKTLAPIVARDFLGRRHATQWMAADPETGLTLLRVSPRAVRPIRSADDGPKLGSQVFVVGSPFGMGHSVSRGHVAGLDRALELGTRQLGGLIQVQAPLYPGDSGAAVVDLRGHWLGLIRGGLAVPGSATDSDPAPTSEPFPLVSRPDPPEPGDDPTTTAAGRSDPDTDFGFAIPTRDGLWIASQLRTHGYVDRAYLGVRLAVTAATAAAGPVVSSGPPSSAPSPPAAGWRTGLTDAPIASAATNPGDPEGAPSSTTAGDGARVGDVIAGTPAALAGLRSGDRIVALDGQPICSHHDLIDRLDRIPAHKGIILGVVRGENPGAPPINIPLQTASRPGPPPAGPASSRTPSETTATRANVPVTPTASRSTPPTPAPAAPASVPSVPDPTPSHDAAPGPGSTRTPHPADPDRPPTDRDRPQTSTSTGSFNDLRLTLPRAFVERIERLERRLEKLETFTPPATPVPSPGAAPRRPGDSVRTP